MSNVLKENIALRKQPTWTVVKQSPNANVITEKECTVDQTEYEEYSFTGNLTEILAQEETELDKGFLNLNAKIRVEGTEDTYYVGKECVCTRTRLNGDIWELRVRINNILWIDSEEISENQAAQNEASFGSQREPRTMSVSTTVLQQSILFRPDYKKLNAVQLGIIKKYMGGASDWTPVPYKGSTTGANGKSHLQNTLLKDLADKEGLSGGSTHPQVAYAVKHPTYYVPAINIQVSYWKRTAPQDVPKDEEEDDEPFDPENPTPADKASVGEPCAPPKGFKLPKGTSYICVFMGRSYNKSASGKGYLIQENYSIGQYDPEMWKSTSTSN